MTKETLENLGISENDIPGALPLGGLFCREQDDENESVKKSRDSEKGGIIAGIRFVLGLNTLTEPEDENPIFLEESEGAPLGEVSTAEVGGKVIKEPVIRLEIVEEAIKRDGILRGLKKRFWG